MNMVLKNVMLCCGKHKRSLRNEIRIIKISPMLSKKKENVKERNVEFKTNKKTKRKLNEKEYY